MVMGLHSRRHSRNVSTATAQLPAGPVENFQIIEYLRRRPGLSKAQFYDHWEHVHAKKVATWAERSGVVGYRQIHTSGIMIPNTISSSSDPDPLSHRELIQPVKFDAIAIWDVASMEKFIEAMDDPYYKDIVAPDEAKILDKDGLGGGIVARFTGRSVTIVKDGRNLVGSMETDQLRALDNLMNRKDLVQFQDAPDM